MIRYAIATLGVLVGVITGDYLVAVLATAGAVYLNIMEGKS